MINTNYIAAAAILGAVLAVSGCVPTSQSSVAALNQAQIIDLPPTATMPTGQARYAGKITSEYNGDLSADDVVNRYNEVGEGDFAMDANFDTNTVNTRLFNMKGNRTTTYSDPQTPLETQTNFAEFSGQLTGPGVISTSNGETSFFGTATGVLTVSRFGTTANNLHTATGQEIETFVDTRFFGGFFKGENAEGVEGYVPYTNDDGSGRVTLWGNKK